MEEELRLLRYFKSSTFCFQGWCTSLDNEDTKRSGEMELYLESRRRFVCRSFIYQRSKDRTAIILLCACPYRFPRKPRVQTFSPDRYCWKLWYLQQERILYWKKKKNKTAILKNIKWGFTFICPAEDIAEVWRARNACEIRVHFA